MPWQRHVIDVATEIDPATGRLVYREVILTVPRQSGKTTLILAAAVHRALAFDRPQRIVYAAQSGKEARDKFIDEHVPNLESSPLGKRSPKPFHVRKTNGHESIIWRNGSRHGISANAKKSGHGGTVDLVFLDEAFAHQDARLEQAFKPAMITRPQPQLWVVSTAGTIDESPYLWSKVETGRELAEAGVTEGVCYFEWSADEDADPGSVETWIGCMPALRHDGNPTGTASIEAVAADFATFALGEFKRAYLNLWTTQRADPVISAEEWAARKVPHSRLVDPVAFAFDVTPDRSRSSIGAASASTTERAHIHVECVRNDPGTDWVVPELVRLRDRHGPLAICCDAAGPAGGLLAQAVAAGLDVKVASTRDHAQACGGFFDAVKDKTLVHIGQHELSQAVDGADRRVIQDSWLWSRKSSLVDISPLVAVTLAKWAWETAELPEATADIW